MNGLGRHDPLCGHRTPSFSDPPDEDIAKLLPILNRALTLGRGPLGLVRWVNGRIQDWAVERGANPGIAQRLARELVGLMHRGSGFDTLAFTPGETVVVPRGCGFTSGSPARPCR